MIFLFLLTPSYVRILFFLENFFMSKYFSIYIVILLSLFPFFVKGEQPQWLEGVYVNADNDALAKSLTFCQNGQALFDFISAGYTVEGNDDKRIITLYSNGAFKLKVSEQGKLLTPADDFTREWLTKTHLQHNPDQSYECKTI